MSFTVLAWGVVAGLLLVGVVMIIGDYWGRRG